MAAPFLLVLLLVVSAGAAAGGDDVAGLPRLEFRGIDDSGRGHASVAPEEEVFMYAMADATTTDDDEAGGAPRLEFRGIDDPGHVHASDAPKEQALMDVMSANGCARFAGLLAATANAGETFQQRLLAGRGRGLTVFCPDDVAVAAFQAKFDNLSADDQLAVLLHHGAGARYGREQFQAFDWVSVSSLSADAATNNSHAITIRDDGDTVRLWPSCGSGAGVRVTKTVSEEAPLAVYVVDAVLLPSHLRQKVDGGDEPAAACKTCGGYLGWLHCCIPAWVTILVAVGSMVGTMVGFLIPQDCCRRIH
ncbi:fasciclin-like protein FLA7 [Hordeum vulgare]|nr:fasciclin-like protein FLA7 [Hordeum vulgare]